MKRSNERKPKEDVCGRPRPPLIKFRARWEVILRGSLPGKDINSEKNIKLSEDPPHHSPSYRESPQPSDKGETRGQRHYSLSAVCALCFLKLPAAERCLIEATREAGGLSVGQKESEGER